MAENDPSPEDLTNDPLLREAPILEGFKVLDPAVLYTKLGAGGMGAVYRGRHFKLDLDVAVKCLKPELAAAEPEFIKRFEREARLCASIAHQNVVRVMDVREKNGLHYLVMEFVRGETAAQRVVRKGRLPEREALAILLGAASGLAEAHGRGIIHRDIKPENILVSLEGRVKLADLGLAKATGAMDAQASMPASRIMGTPQYMPPEQWLTTEVTAAADIWALGASFYFLCAGRAGIAAEGTYLTMGKRIQEQDYPTLRAERPDLRPEVHALFERCVQRDPLRRYADAKALLRELKHLVVEDDEALADAAGVASARGGVVTPPPRETLLRIRAQLETKPDGSAAPELGDTVPAPAAPTAVHPGPVPATAPRAGGGTMPVGAVAGHRRRSWLPVALAALLSLGGLGGAYAAGWFGDRRGDPASTGQPTTVSATATPSPSGATGGPGRAPEGPPAVPAGAPVASDSAAAPRTTAAVAGPAPAAAAADRQQQLLAAVAILEPASGAECTSRRLVVAGAIAAQLCRRVRVAVIAGGELPAAFPAAAATASRTGDEFRAEVDCAGDGDHLVWIEAMDDQGAVATLPPRPVRIDTQPPRLQFTNMPQRVRAAAVEVAGVVAELQGGQLRIDDQVVAVGADGAFAVTLALPREGDIPVRAEARDRLGNAATARFVVAVDRSGPQVAWLGPEPAQALSPGPTFVNGSVRDPAGVQQVVVNGAAAQVEGESWQATVEIAAAVPGQPVVPTRVEVVATDTLGNRSEPFVQLLRAVAVPLASTPTPTPAPAPAPTSAPTPAPEVAPEPPARIATGIGLLMVPIPARTFAMGSPADEVGRRSDEVRHTVVIQKPFWIAETEVTRRQWRAVMGSEPWAGDGAGGSDDVAASHISWLMAVEFCDKLTIQERIAGRLPMGYRCALPSEAEWELACRGGSDRAFASGDDLGTLRDYAVFGRQGASVAVVRTRLPNGFGLFDMHGNVHEWCADFADLADGVITDTYRDGAVDPLCLAGARRVRRGGSWLSPSAACRSAARMAGGPGGGGNDVGLRPAFVLRPQTAPR